MKRFTVVPLYHRNVSLLLIQFHAKTRISFNRFRLNFTGMRLLADFPRGSLHTVRVDPRGVCASTPGERISGKDYSG